MLRTHPDSEDGKFYLTHFRGLENTTFMATASGKRLERGLDDWNKLPATERKPGAVPIKDLAPGKKADPDPPPGGLIAKVYLRSFGRDDKQGFAYEKVLSLGEGRYESEPGRDHLWLTRDEWRSFVPKDPRPGDTFPVPPPVRDRIVRYHLLLSPDRVVSRGCALEDIRSMDLQLTVENVLPHSLQLRLEGSAVLAHPAEAKVAQSTSGYDARLYGRLTFDKKKDAFSRFDIVAFGPFWARSGDWRQGKSDGGWLGIAFELADQAKGGANALMSPPYLLMREGNDYFGSGR